MQCGIVSICVCCYYPARPLHKELPSATPSTEELTCWEIATTIVKYEALPRSTGSYLLLMTSRWLYLHPALFGFPPDSS